MIHMQAFDSDVGQIKQHAAEWLPIQWVGPRKSFTALKPNSGDAIRSNIMHIPATCQLRVKVPQEPAKPVVHDRGSVWRSPKHIRFARAVERPPKERIEATNMVHM